MNYSQLILQTLPVIEKAAAFIHENSQKVTDADIETKARNSLVSFVDINAEKILVEGLSSVLPEATFITEEGTTAQAKSEFTWIIDPLDGTTNFLQHIPFYSVSVGLVHNQELVMGIVNDVVQKEMFYAWKGGGAWCNGKQIFVSQRSEIADAVVATGFPYAAKNVTPALVNAFEFYLKHAKGIRRLGSAALDLAYVACGRFDMYYEKTLNAWDMAGGIMLVMEAGGKVSDFSGGQLMLERGEVISANSQVFPAVFKAMNTLFTP